MHRFLPPVTAFTVGLVLGRASAEPTIRQLRDAFHEAVYRAEHDPLTGLPNRDAARRHYHANIGRSWTVLLIDLDDFKTVNDRHGHHAGDAILVEIANRLHHAAHAHHGRAFRLAGDEFLIQLPAEHADASLDTIYNITTSVLPPELVDYAWRGIQVLSFGVARADGLGWSEALRRADIALYHSKLSGEIHTYQAGMYHPVTPPPEQRRTRLRNLAAPGTDQ
jgi:diguanylate cyclase (GGDEF)-like protein